MSVMSPRRYSPQTDNVPTTCQSQDTVGRPDSSSVMRLVFWHSDQKFALAQTARCGLAPAQYQQDTHPATNKTQALKVPQQDSAHRLPLAQPGSNQADRRVQTVPQEQQP